MNFFSPLQEHDGGRQKLGDKYDKLNNMFKQSKPSSIVSSTTLLANPISKLDEPIKTEPSEMIYAKGDSTTSLHYWREDNKEVLSNIEEISGP